MSLIGSTYKIISKCLAMRLKEVLSGLILREQGVFLQGRSMADGVLCANKLIDARICQGRHGILFKLDLKKAYDHVNWEFLMYVLHRCGFGIKWRKWIWKYISLASYSVLLNEIPKGHFDCSRGIRQGDPISPLLFLLVAGVLGSMLEKAAEVGEVGMFEGFSPGNGKPMISHLQFANDTIIFLR